MQRRHFIETTLVGLPLLGTAQVSPSGSRQGKGFKVVAGAGRQHGHVKLKGGNDNIQDCKMRQDMRGNTCENSFLQAL